MFGAEIAPLAILAIVYFFIALENKPRLHVFITILIFFIFNASDIWSYSFMPQARRFINIDLEYVLESEDFHALRFFVVYPAVKISETLGADLDYIFTLYGTTAILFILMNILRFINRLEKKSRIIALTRYYCLVLPGIIFLAMLINGRSASAFLGISIVLFQQIEAILTQKLSYKFVVYNVFAVFLSSISSGTLFVTYSLSTVGLVFLLTMGLKKTRKNYCMAILSTLGMLLFLPHIIQGFEKIIDYFGNIEQILEHGFGKVLALSDFLGLTELGLFSFCIFAAFSHYFLISYRQKSFLLPPLLSIACAGLAGIFGILAATMAIPGLFIIIVAQGVSIREENVLVNR